MAYSKPTELLREMDSHGIYDAGMLDQCQFDTANVPTYGPDETRRAMARRGLGGNLIDQPADHLIYGWTTAEALVRQFTGSVPGDKFFGRGSAFRANLAALEAAGK